MLPGIEIQEYITSVTPEVISGEIGAHVGEFEKGPIDTPIYISDPEVFKTMFGRGYGNYFNSWYQVYNYLLYSSGIWVVRSAGKNSFNASSDDTNFTFNNYNEFCDNWSNITENVFYATSAGEAGNLLWVHVVNIDDYENGTLVNGVSVKSIFPYFDAEYTGIVVGRKDEIKEVFYEATVDLNSNDGQSTRYPISSTYIFAKFNHISTGLYTLYNGVTAQATTLDVKDSHEIFEDKLYTIDNMIANQDYPNHAIELAEVRKDMLVFVGTYVKGEFQSHYTINEVKLYIRNIIRSDYVVFINQIKEQFDGFSNKTRLVNIAGDVAGLKSKTSSDFPYQAGAGITKGAFKKYKSSHLKWSDNEIEELYNLGVNFTRNKYMSSQKTFSYDDNSFNRINIRSLFNHLSRDISKVQMYNVFEHVNSHTYNKIRESATRILETARGNRSIQAYNLVLYESSDNNIIVDIIVNPTYVAESITLRMYNTGTISVI